jgi:putative heme-binding domain-containing protein
MPRPPKTLQQCSNEELVDRLTSPIAWQRRSASQMLVERHAIDAGRALSGLLKGTSPEAAILGMHVLNRLGLFEMPFAIDALRHPHPQVVGHAIGLSRNASWFTSVAPELIRHSRSKEATLQWQLAMSAAELPQEARWQLLDGLRETREPLVRAVMVAAAGNESHRLIADPPIAAEELRSWIQLILPIYARAGATVPAGLRDRMAAGMRRENQRGVWLDGLRALNSASDAGRLLAAIDPVAVAAALKHVDQEVQSAIQWRGQDRASESARAATWLGLLAPEVRGQLADQLLVPSVAEGCQAQAIESLIWSNPESATGLLLDRFQNLTPGLQQSVLSGLLRYKPSATAIASALDSKKVLASQIPPDVRQRLLDSGDKDLKARLSKSLQAVSADRAAIIDKYRAALSSPMGTAGPETFQRVCSQCHRLGEVGNDVGPPLKQLADKSPEQLLETILDPNREVDPKFASYSLLATDGRVFAGIIAEESAAQIVLAESGGKRHAIPRSEIDHLKSTGVSFMPVGLEQSITPEQMNDLIQYLKSIGAKDPSYRK